MPMLSRFLLAASLAATGTELPAVTRGGARIDGGRTLGDIIDEGRVRRRENRNSMRCHCHWTPIVGYCPAYCVVCGFELDTDHDTYRATPQQQASVKRQLRADRNLWLVERGGLKAATP